MWGQEPQHVNWWTIKRGEQTEAEKAMAQAKIWSLTEPLNMLLSQSFQKQSVK